MANKTNQERVDAYFKTNKGKVFQTSDGTLFLQENLATGHARTLKNSKVSEHKAPPAKTEKPKATEPAPKKSKSFNDQSVKEIETKLQKETDIEKIESYLAEEQRSSQPRTTAIEAFEDRLKELNKTEDKNEDQDNEPKS